MSEQHARRMVAARSSGVCERCAGGAAVEWHHRRNRSQGGGWTAGNGLHLCSPCHRWVTDHPAEAAHTGHVVWSWQDPLTVPVRHAFYGWAVLDDAGGLTLALEDG